MMPTKLFDALSKDLVVVGNLAQEIYLRHVTQTSL